MRKVDVRRKFVTNIVRKKRIFFVSLLVCFFVVGFGFAVFSSNIGVNGSLKLRRFDTLYKFFENVAQEGEYAREYTGFHQDSMDVSKSKKGIYYWYGSDDESGTTMSKMNNIVFANQCWKMIRTTDTGGVRLLYNGEPSTTGSGNNISYNCGTSRSGHIGGVLSTKNLEGKNYYAASYTTTVSGATTTYSLVDPILVDISASDPRDLIVDISFNTPYTCSSSSTSCTTLYKVVSQSSGSIANVYSSTQRDIMGLSAYGNGGYMSNSSQINSMSVSSELQNGSSTVLYYNNLSSTTLASYKKYYFSNSYSYNSSDNVYVLNNPVKGSSISNSPSSWVGKYFCRSDTLSSCQSIGYVSAVKSGNPSILYYAGYGSGKDYDDSAYQYVFSDSIIENNDGSVEMTGNVQMVLKKDWSSEYSDKVGKFVCMPGYHTYDSVNNKYICSDIGVSRRKTLIYITESTITDFKGFQVYKYGNSIAADGDNYKLIGKNNEKDTLQYIYNWSNDSTTDCFSNSNNVSQCGYKTLSKSHYTCYNFSGICSTYYFVTNVSSSSHSSIPITGGKYVSLDFEDPNNILYDMFYSNKANEENSTIKDNIELWYKNTIYDGYDQYVDDTIYCSNRNIFEENGVKQVGSMNPEGEIPGTFDPIKFADYSITDDLSCPNIIDQFSVSNPAAPLTYKVGLISTSEMNLLNQAKARTSSTNYWVGSLYTSNISYSQHRVIAYNGSFSSNNSGSVTGVRPAISLISGIGYTKGVGSTSDPFIADTPPNILTINPPNMTLRDIGSTATFTVDTNMEGTVEWESSDDSVVTVNNGVVTVVDSGLVTITARIGNVSATADVKVISPFVYESWETIIANVKAGNTSRYHVGDTKKVELGNGLGTHIIRVANNSVSDECGTEGFSLTACGFVLEFSDIIDRHVLNPSYSNITDGDGNIGGWFASEMRDYLNNPSDSESVYNSLPAVIRNAIIETTVVSGHGSAPGEENFITTDKLYLLSAHEIWVDEIQSSSGIDSRDSAYYNTRQLDYYKLQNVNTKNYYAAEKRCDNALNSNNIYSDVYWTRTADLTSTGNFIYGAGYYSTTLSGSGGVSPAFRLAGPAVTYVPPCYSFENDSWETIASNAQSGNYSQYAVGCRKKVALGNDLGTHYVRVVNNSNPSECSTNGFSQSACGFILEFSDFIMNRRISPDSENSNYILDGVGNVGGWEASELRNYLNNTSDSESFYNSLPSVIRNAIIDTTVVSGHGSTPGETNLISVDKLYLLSAREIYRDPSDFNDTSSNSTRQLDFYKSKGVTMIDNMWARKQGSNGYSNSYWLRSSDPNSNRNYSYITSSGTWATTSTTNFGIFPVFRLAGPTSTYVNPCQSFQNDSWETIVSNAQSNNYSQYSVGCKKRVTLGNDIGTYMIRVVNNSTPSICSTNNFSQTACGFVLEFTDVILNRTINSSNTNVDGWPVSAMRTYLNSEIDTSSFYNSLPATLKNAIIDTTVVSGHGSTAGETNFISVDKIYLLSSHEVLVDADGNTSSGIDYNDSAYNNTRQLDYYSSKGVTTSNTNDLVKYLKNGYSRGNYWLRTALLNNTTMFYMVTQGGTIAEVPASNSYGVSPAFRLAGPASTYVPPCQAFEDDSWETIVSNAQSGNYSQYTLGCKKDITLGNSLGTHKVRVANNTSPSVCSGTNFSKTACGFVLEFVDVIASHRMNPYDSSSTSSGNGSIGGWPASEMRTYLNSSGDSTSIFNSLPSTIKNAIIDTKVISGYESGHSGGNYSSTDKLYLLADIEIDGTANASNDTLTTSETRQLDYYRENGVTSSNRVMAVKKDGTSNSTWWLRSASFQYSNPFLLVVPDGTSTLGSSSSSYGVSPAFRLAE